MQIVSHSQGLPASRLQASSSSQGPPPKGEAPALHASDLASSANAFSQLPAVAFYPTAALQVGSAQPQPAFSTASQSSPAILAPSSAVSSSSPCVRNQHKSAEVAFEGGSTSSFMPMQGIASQGGSSSNSLGMYQPRGLHGQRPRLVPPRDVEGTSVASASTMRIPNFPACLAALRSASWPQAGTSSRPVAQPHSEASGYWNFGCQVSRRSALTRVTLALPELCEALNAFLGVLFPRCTWNAVCVARNIVTAARRDTANVQGSLNLSVSLGSFTGGQLWLEDAQGSVLRDIPELQQKIPGKLLCTKESPTSFPSHAWHMTEPFVGERWVLTAFTMPNCPYELLEPLGFPKPELPAQVHNLETSQPHSVAPASGGVSAQGFSASSGLVNWGRPSPFGFKHHSLAALPAIPRPFPEQASASLPLEFPARIFLDVCSGHAKPLSAAVESAGFATLSIDILLDSSMDLLQDSFFEQLLFICGSGSVGYCAASPSCAHYSRLKLSNGPPHAVRTPEYLDGVPGLRPADLAKVQESKELLSRCCKCASVVYAAGGHSHLEQPADAMSWAEVGLQSWLHECSAYLVAVAACGYGMPWAKTWLFACSFSPMKKLGCVCEHGPHAHPVLQGLDASGIFRSSKTAQYPASFCTSFASLIQVLLSQKGSALAVQDALLRLATITLGSA